ncbi:MAG: hypothetical protein NWE89_06485 [Candidatus Bathyarchaeota archaeon]|nr:hypothetical protein [Candidatus Bathyarchaeota archaeon]
MDKNGDWVGFLQLTPESEPSKLEIHTPSQRYIAPHGVSQVLISDYALELLKHLDLIIEYRGRIGSYNVHPDKQTFISLTPRARDAITGLSEINFDSLSWYLKSNLMEAS